MEKKYGLLRINAKRGGTIPELQSYLIDLQKAYENLYAFELIINKAKIQEFYLSAPKGLPALKPIRKVSEIILPQDQIIVSKIRIESPGFWEFLGSLNPLQQIREYLKDRHERRKDLEWREEQERKKMTIENRLMETKLLNDQIEILKSIGYSEDEIRRIIVVHWYEPLKELNKHQDSGMIEDADIEHREHREDFTSYNLA